MATAGSLLCEDQFLCPICLDVFTRPVSLSCGHNFCKACITDCWNSTASGLYQCPMCKETFNTRPELHVNCLVSEMADQFRKSVKEEQERDDYYVQQEVFCDWCTDGKIIAAKSCLVCLASYCKTHLEPHHRVATLRNHQLVEPMGNMESRMCKKHNKMLELFCRDEQRCICVLCSQTDHRSHDVVALEEESGKIKDEKRKTKAECEQKIQERERKLKEIRRAAKLNKEVSEKENADGVEILTTLVASIQKRQAEISQVIDRKQREVQQKAEQSMAELQREISELQLTCVECEKLSQSQDHLHVLLSPSTSPPCSDWSKVLMENKLSAGTVRAALTKMEKTLNEGLEELLKQLEEHRLQVPTQSAPPLSSDPPEQPPPIIPPSPQTLPSRERFQPPAKPPEEHQVPPWTRSSQQQHPNVNVTCDVCGRNVSSTHHHHCTLCRDYDLCTACFTSGNHREHSLFLEKVFGSEPYTGSESYTHTPHPNNRGAYCDGCGGDLSLTHHRHCTLCRNYDLCSACFRAGNHSKHSMFLEKVFGGEPYTTHRETGNVGPEECRPS